MIDFTATWCKPCLEYVPHLNELQKKYKQDNLLFLSISDEKEARISKILEKITDTLFVGWYLVEFENGERLKLRTFEPRKVFFSAGDIGILRYQGITILSFQKENRPPMR